MTWGISQKLFFVGMLLQRFGIHRMSYRMDKKKLPRLASMPGRKSFLINIVTLERIFVT